MSVEVSEPGWRCPTWALACGTGALLLLVVVGFSMVSPQRSSTLRLMAAPFAHATNIYEETRETRKDPEGGREPQELLKTSRSGGSQQMPKPSEAEREETEEKEGKGWKEREKHKLFATSTTPKITGTTSGTPEATAGLLWEKVPAVAAYLWRGQVVCGDYAWRGSASSASADSETSWKKAILIFLPAQKGVSSIMFWQVKFMVAWMLRRPILLHSDGLLFTLLHSRHRPSRMQVSNITPAQVQRELGANATLEPPKFVDRDDCNAHFKDAYTGKNFNVNMLKPPSTWKISSNASLLLGVGSKNLRKLKHTVPLDCRNRMIQQLKGGRWGGSDKNRAAAISRDTKNFGKCSMRFALGDPQPDMLRFIHPLLQELASTKAFLVGIHFRMGDTTMSKELGRVSGANNDKRSQVSLSTYLIHVNNLLQVLTEVLRPLDARPVAFVASDSAAAVTAAEKKLTCKVLTNPGLSVHSTDKKASSAEIQKVYADWYLLALSGILLSPSPGTNCNDGCGSGFSKTAGQLGLPWLSVLGRDITAKDIQNIRRLPVDELAKQGIYKKRGASR